jgi:hypothetical protein
LVPKAGERAIVRCARMIDHRRIGCRPMGKAGANTAALAFRGRYYWGITSYALSLTRVGEGPEGHSVSR